MIRSVVFLLHEQCEVYAFIELVKYSNQIGEKKDWGFICSQGNTDFDYLKIQESLNLGLRTKVQDYTNSIDTSYALFSFSNTGKEYECDAKSLCRFDISDILSTRNIDRGKRILHPTKKTIVIGNTKIKYPLSPLQKKMLIEVEKRDKYNFLWIPRHPVPQTDYLKLETLLPLNIELVNTIGELAELQGSADLVLMGRLFSPGGVLDTEHNPFEATTNSFAICSRLNNIPEAYHWIYRESGLILECDKNPIDSFLHIDELLSNKNLDHLLVQKKKWMTTRRDNVLSKIINKIESFL